MHRLAQITDDQPHPFRRCTSAIIGNDPIRRLALCLTVTGWSLVWARGLSLTDLYPAWLAACIFTLGIALIPLHRERPVCPTAADSPPGLDQGNP